VSSVKERGVTFSGSRKEDLVRLGINAEELNIEINPDGLSENSSRNVQNDKRKCLE